MNAEEYWKKYVEICGDGLDCGMCKSRFVGGWNAALKYGSEKPSHNISMPKLPTKEEVIMYIQELPEFNGVTSREAFTISKVYKFIAGKIGN